MEVITVGVILNDVTMMMSKVIVSIPPFSGKENADDYFE
jgi:hypothetical protein